MKKVSLFLVSWLLLFFSYAFGDSVRFIACPYTNVNGTYIDCSSKCGDLFDDQQSVAACERWQNDSCSGSVPLECLNGDGNLCRGAESLPVNKRVKFVTDAPLSVSDGFLDLCLNYEEEITAIVGVISSDFKKIKWLNGNCIFDDNFSLDTFIRGAKFRACYKVVLPFTEGYLFWMVLPKDILNFDWDKDPYDLKVYRFQTTFPFSCDTDCESIQNGRECWVWQSAHCLSDDLESVSFEDLLKWIYNATETNQEELNNYGIRARCRKILKGISRGEIYYYCVTETAVKLLLKEETDGSIVTYESYSYPLYFKDGQASMGVAMSKVTSCVSRTDPILYFIHLKKLGIYWKEREDEELARMRRIIERIVDPVRQEVVNESISNIYY